MANATGHVRNLLESRGFKVSVDTVHVRSLLGDVVLFERVIGVVEGKIRVSWRYWPRFNRCEINISIYGGGDIAEELESKGVIVEVVDDAVYGKIKVKGNGVDKLKEIVDVVHGIG